MQTGAGGNAPQGAPQGGQWRQEKYCGLITWLVGIFIFPFVCCCPCDDRLVSVVVVISTRPLRLVYTDILCVFAVSRGLCLVGVGLVLCSCCCCCFLFVRVSLLR